MKYLFLMLNRAIATGWFEHDWSNSSMSLFDFFQRQLEPQYEVSADISKRIGTAVRQEQQPLSEPKGAFSLNRDIIQLRLPIAQKIHQDYLLHGIQNKNAGLHAAVLNEFAHTLIYDDDVRVLLTPNMPPIFPQLMQYLRDVNTPKSSVIELISQDSHLAASVLRASRCSLHNPSKQSIESFDQAAGILGLSDLKIVAMTALLGAVVNSAMTPFIHSTLWPYTCHTAIISQLLAKDSQAGFSAYLSGLFHSIGEMTFLNQLASHPILLVNVETYHYLDEQYFERLTLAILKDWKLPEGIIDEVRSAAVMPVLNGNVSNITNLSSHLAKLIYLYQNNVWSEERVIRTLDSMHMHIEQLDAVIALSAGQLLNA